jgi:hypothetical protein
MQFGCQRGMGRHRRHARDLVSASAEEFLSYTIGFWETTVLPCNVGCTHIPAF